MFGNCKSELSAKAMYSIGDFMISTCVFVSSMTSSGSFDGAARLYDEIRPSYPEELVGEIVRVSGINSKGRILEIGCGTGQATLLFASSGYRMLCLDIGESLIAFAKEKCREYPDVEFLRVSFEDWEPEVDSFDLVISATAFHWVKPEIGYPKAAQVVRRDGHIALFWNLHPTPYTGFFEDVQDIYQRVVPEWSDPREKPTTEQWIQNMQQQIERTGLFSQVSLKLYRWTRTFNSDDYVKLLNTFSDHRSLDEKRRKKLFREIRKLINSEYGGSIERPYLSALFYARKL